MRLLIRRRARVAGPVAAPFPLRIVPLPLPLTFLLRAEPFPLPLRAEPFPLPFRAAAPLPLPLPPNRALFSREPAGRGDEFPPPPVVVCGGRDVTAARGRARSGGKRRPGEGEVAARGRGSEGARGWRKRELWLEERRWDEDAMAAW
ncbi:unnamed protein product [Closterium sp. NIES-54]